MFHILEDIEWRTSRDGVRTDCGRAQCEQVGKLCESEPKKGEVWYCKDSRWREMEFIRNDSSAEVHPFQPGGAPRQLRSILPGNSDLPSKSIDTCFQCSIIHCCPAIRFSAGVVELADTYG